MSHDDTHEEAASGVDPAKPSAGRMYDFFLNGRLHTEVDRAAARKVVEVVPEIHYLANANRVFLQRAVGVMARAGVRQFVDVGAGLPTQWNTHEVAQAINPGARVVYVDNDPMVLTEARELLRQRGETDVIYVDGDVRDPDGILRNPEFRELIDLSEPVGYVHVAVWHFVADADDPRALLRKYLDAVPSGSFLALSHASSDGQDPDRVRRFGAIYENATEQLYFRTREEITQLFDGLEFVASHDGADAGLSYIDMWGSKNPASVDPAHTWAPCGLARKP